MTLVKVMIAGLMLTATLTGAAIDLFDENVAMVVALVVGITTQHGALFAALWGWPNGYWAFD